MKSQPLFTDARVQLQTFFDDLSLCSEMPAVVGETGQADNIDLVVARVTGRMFLELLSFITFHKLHKHMIKYYF